MKPSPTAKVRAQAINCISSFIEHNPFGGSLVLSRFEEGLAREKKALESMETHVVTGTQGSASVDLELQAVQLKLLYYEDGARFINEIHRIAREIHVLLDSGSDSDVVEALAFFVCCHQFHIEEIVSSVPARPTDTTCRILSLIWRKNLQKHVCDAFEAFFFRPCDPANHESYISLVVKNLLHVMSTCDDVVFYSAQKLLRLLCKNGCITDPMVKVLWDTFALRVPNTSEAQSLQAIRILACVSGLMANHLNKNLPYILDSIFGDRGRKAPLLVLYSALAMKSLHKTHHVLSNEDPFFCALLDFLAHMPNSEEEIQLTQYTWYGAAAAVLDLIYRLANDPPALCSSLLVTFYKSLENLVAKESQSINGLMEKHEYLLGRVLFLVGHVATKQLVYMEEIGERLKKKRQREKESKQATFDLEKEMGVEEEVNEFDSEQLDSAVETELVIGNGLLASFVPLVVTLCRLRHSDPILGPPSLLALCKFMAISVHLCEKHLQLLFTVLRESSLVRANRFHLCCF
jgi:condensin complex subunit 1